LSPDGFLQTLAAKKISELHGQQRTDRPLCSRRNLHAIAIEFANPYWNLESVEQLERFSYLLIAALPFNQSAQSIPLGQQKLSNEERINEKQKEHGNGQETNDIRRIKRSN